MFRIVDHNDRVTAAKVGTRVELRNTVSPPSPAFHEINNDNTSNSRLNTALCNSAGLFCPGHSLPKNVPIMKCENGDHESPRAPATSQATKSSAQQVPPPESQVAIQTRFRVLAAFWAVIIFLGFPIWWKTTSIYRAHLPIQEMVDWADGKVQFPPPGPSSQLSR